MPVPVEAAAHFVRSVPGQLCEVPDLKIVQGTMRYVSVGGIAESIEWFTEDQAFLRRIIRLLANSALPLPLPVIIKLLSLFLSLPVCRRSSLLTEEEWGGGVGEEPNIQPRETAWSSLNHSLLSRVQ